MAQDAMQVKFAETTVARVNTTVSGFIDDFWASIDVNYTPSEIELFANLKLTVENAGGTEKVFSSSFRWIEDAATQNTRLKNVFVAFTAGLTAMETASSYTTVTELSGSINIKVTYT